MNKLKNFISPMLIILSAVVIRLLPHAPNFAPVAAMALFGGTYLNKKYSLAIVFVTMLVSDYLLLYIHPFSTQFINLSKIYPLTALLHSTTLFVYGSFMLISLLGVWIRSHKSAKNIFSACLFSSILFFLITNFGVWATGVYARNLNGLWESYVMGIPFFKNTVSGDLFYVGVFFGSFEFIQNLVSGHGLSKLFVKK